MANRHKACRAKGGRVEYNNSPVEAESKRGDGGYKRGGKVTHMSGDKAKSRFKRGGAVSGSTGSPFSSAKSGSGGGADSHPFSSAHVGPSGGK